MCVCVHAKERKEIKTFVVILAKLQFFIVRCRECVPPSSILVQRFMRASILLVNDWAVAFHIVDVTVVVVVVDDNGLAFQCDVPNVLL